MKMTLLDEYFEKSLQAIEKAKKKHETKFEIEFEHVIKNYLEALGFKDVEAQYEEKTGNIRHRTGKREDSTYGRVIIEYEPVGKLSILSGKKQALKQICDYLSSYPKEQRVKLAGIVFDGEIIIFVRWVDENWYIDERTYSKKNFELMMNFITGLYKISFKQLPYQFGLHRELTIKSLKLFYDKCKIKNDRSEMLFNEWKLRFSSIYGNAFKKEKIKEHFRTFAKIIGIDTNSEIRVVFSVHTYYALIVKLIAAEVSNNLFRYITHSHMSNLLNSDNLNKELRNIEEGRFFRGIGIENFTEGTFLSWYLDVWDNDIEQNIREIIEQLSLFDFAEFLTKPEFVVDYLKNFYQEVFHKDLRHDLGEFYTPDWLARYVINLSGYDGDIDKRILDPACGSGTFLVAVLNKIYEKNKRVKHKEKLIKDICNNIVGFDINPVAVLTARTNFLISLSRFDFQKTRLVLPIYLTDSIVHPVLNSQTQITDKTTLYQIKTTKSTFKIPRDIRMKIVPIMEFIKQSMENKQQLDGFLNSIKKRFDLDDKILHHVEELYEKLLDLESKKQNKIWCDIIINQFATLFYDKFDYVIGNPPWVNWVFLDDDYQKHLRDINDDYGLYFTKGLESRLGKVGRDFSAIFFYVCSDVFLKDKGIIAFLIKPMYQIESGMGFRNFNRVTINPKMPIKLLKSPIKILQVEDITKENPFDINNEVSLILAKKGLKNKYPIKYKKWSGKRTHELVDYLAEPSDENNILSTWMIYQGKKPIGAFGKFEYNIRTGIYYGLKEPFFDLKLLIDKGKYVQIKNCNNDIKDIEKKKVYPMILSRHVKKWKLGDSNGEKYSYCILPQEKPGKDNEVELKNTCPKTWDWLHNFKKELLNRKSGVLSKKPFYSIFGLGDWDSPYKIVWKRMGFYPNFVVISSVQDKILGKKLVLPENVTHFIPISNEKEAHYICAVLNSNIVKESLKTLSSKSKSGLPSTIINKIRLDKFDKNNKLHLKLSKLSQKAHMLANKNDISGISKVEKEINLSVKQLLKTKPSQKKIKKA